MIKIPVDDIDLLIKTIKDSIRYKSFLHRQLCSKIRREKEAWGLIVKSRGNYSEDAFRKICNTIDVWVENNPNRRWFAATFNPNRNLKKILENSDDRKRNFLMKNLLFSDYSSEEALDICLKDPVKIPFLSNCAASIFLYLSDSESNNVFCDTHQRALYKIGFVSKEKIIDSNFGKQYRIFNDKAIEFREKFGFKPAEVDYVLSFIGYRNIDNKEYFKIEDGYFLVDEDALNFDEFGFLPIDDDCLENEPGDSLPKGPVTTVGEELPLSEIPEGPIPKPRLVKVITEEWMRSEEYKERALKNANYTCELDMDHETFENKKNDKMYMEGHHLIPMKMQKDFENSIDVPENIVCLCPNCHRLLHFAKPKVRDPFLKLLYTKRILVLNEERDIYYSFEELCIAYNKEDEER